MMPKVIDISELASDGPYAPQAYAFVQDGLRYTVEREHGDAERIREEGGDTHVSGRELARGLRDFAIQRYGLLARRVLEHWNIHRTDDFGRIVYRMIDAGLMSRQDQDRLEDFFSVYSFDEAFDPRGVLEALEAGDESAEAFSMAESSSN